MLNSKYNIKTILSAAVWITAAAGTIVLLLAAIERRHNERCVRIEISISGVQNNFFIDKKDVMTTLEKINEGRLQKSPLHSINLASMETELKKNVWIKKAELYFDNNSVLQVKITEREPIARVFSLNGNSFYLDSSLTRLPLSEKFSPRLPVFTDFPSDAARLSGADSAVLRGIRGLSLFIHADPFWMAQIDQVVVTPERSFDLVPKMGNQLIHFGDAKDCGEKFGKLLCFYKQVLTKIGWSRYASIDVQFKGQVVGVKRGAADIKLDSMRSIQIMKALIADAQRSTDDSSRIQLDQPDDDNGFINAPENSGDQSTDNTSRAGKNTKKRISVIPLHNPEKPTSNFQSSTRKSGPSGNSSSVERPGPAPAKSKVIQHPGDAREAGKIKKSPKAIMPPKSDY